MSLIFRPRRSLVRWPPRGGATGELERLARLHKSGALTDDEFAAAKEKLLGVLPRD